LRGSPFYCANCVPWTSYLVANSDCGCSPRVASRARYALKAAEWLQRGLLTICSPHTGEFFAQLTKAVTFYSSVRICGATFQS
jgi:hypothetical protein